MNTRQSINRALSPEALPDSRLAGGDPSAKETVRMHTTPDLPTQSTLLTVNGVAKMLACSPRTVYRLVDAGRIPQPVKIGGMVRWPRELLEKWIAQGCPVANSARNGQYLARKGR